MPQFESTIQEINQQFICYSAISDIYKGIKLLLLNNTVMIICYNLSIFIIQIKSTLLRSINISQLAQTQQLHGHVKCIYAQLFPPMDCHIMVRKINCIEKWDIQKLQRLAFLFLCFSIISYFAWQEYLTQIAGWNYRLKGNLNSKMTKMFDGHILINMIIS